MASELLHLQMEGLHSWISGHLKYSIATTERKLLIARDVFKEKNSFLILPYYSKSFFYQNISVILSKFTMQYSNIKSFDGVIKNLRISQNYRIPSRKGPQESCDPNFLGKGTV